MVDGAATLETVVNGGLTWINLERPSRDMIEKEVISKGYPFHELNIYDITHQDGDQERNRI